MFRKALACVLMLGTSTAAMARPAPVRETVRTTEVVHAPIRKEIVVRKDIVREPVRKEIIREPVRTEIRHDYHPIVRDRFYVAPTYYAPVVYQSPLASGEMFLSLGGAAGTGIELLSNGGSTFVTQAVIQYADGRTQTVNVDQNVNASNPSLELASDNCPISGVTIFGQGSGVSATVV